MLLGINWRWFWWSLLSSAPIICKQRKPLKRATVWEALRSLCIDWLDVVSNHYWLLYSYNSVMQINTHKSIQSDTRLVNFRIHQYLLLVLLTQHKQMHFDWLSWCNYVIFLSSFVCLLSDAKAVSKKIFCQVNVLPTVLLSCFLAAFGSSEDQGANTDL